MSALPREPDIIRLPPPLRPAPEPEADTPVRSPCWRRWRAALARSWHAVFRTDLRPPTDLERHLRAQVAQLRREVWQRDQELYNQQLKLAQCHSEIKLHKLELEHLLEIHERDRARTQADHAAYSHWTAVALLHRDGRGGPQPAG